MSPKRKQESAILAQNHCRSACARSAVLSTNTVQRESLLMVSYPASSLHCLSPASRSSATMTARSMSGPGRRFWPGWRRVRVALCHFTKPTGKTTTVTSHIIIHIHPPGNPFLGDGVCNTTKGNSYGTPYCPIRTGPASCSSRWSLLYHGRTRCIGRRTVGLCPPPSWPPAVDQHRRQTAWPALQSPGDHPRQIQAAPRQLHCWSGGRDDAA